MNEHEPQHTEPQHTELSIARIATADARRLSLDPVPRSTTVLLMPPTEHIPVLLDEVIAALSPQPGQTIIDGTLGAGGHARRLAQLVDPGGRLLALDLDPQAVAAAELGFTGQDLPLSLCHSSYVDIPEVLDTLQITTVDGVLLDLGLSSDQLSDRERGFSFAGDGALDMRYDPQQGEPAWRLLERLSGEHLADLIFSYGEERYSRRIARAIVKSRQADPVRTSGQLAELVQRAVPRSADSGRIHPATRTFQALRIAVNDELRSLENFLRRMPEHLHPGGRLAIISFHSLEDRRVKEAFRDDPRLQVITRRPIRSSEAEIERNPRSRSAKMRVAQRNEST